MTPSFTRIAKLEAIGVRSLTWHEDQLVDWVGGGNSFSLDGSTARASVIYGFRFDNVCSSADGKYAVIYEQLGTKGLLLEDGEIIRELNRSFNHANVYEYPVCFAKLESQRDVLIHCPDEYNRIEIEDVRTGELLTKCDTRKPKDFFHSRLATSPNGKLLLSAGWVWHPFDAVCVWDIAESIDQPTSLDSSQLFPSQSTEVSSAAFLDNEHLLLSTSDESFAGDEYEVDELRPSTISVWNIPKRKIESQVNVEERVGRLMPINRHYALGFFEAPKIICLESGQIVARLPELKTGTQTSSIIHHNDALPPIAADVANHRFAVANENEIHVFKVES